MTHIDPAHLPPDVYRLWCGSARGKATGHHDQDADGGLTWQEFSRRETRFLYPRRQVISDPELAAVDRLWFRSSAHDGRPTTHNPLKDWKAQQHRREVETHETVLLPIPPTPRSLSPALNGDEKLWQWESWEEIERDPDKTEKRPTVKPVSEEHMDNDS